MTNWYAVSRATELENEMRLAAAEQARRAAIVERHARAAEAATPNEKPASSASRTVQRLLLSFTRR